MWYIAVNGCLFITLGFGEHSFRLGSEIPSVTQCNRHYIMAGKFCSERNGPVYFANSTIFDNTDIVISTNRVGGNHWTIVATEIKNAHFVYMDPKGDLHTDLTACHKIARCGKCSAQFSTGNMVVTQLPTSYSSTVFLHARQLVNDNNNCGIYTSMVCNNI